MKYPISITVLLLSLFAVNATSQIAYNDTKADSLLHSLIKEGLTVGSAAAVSIDGKIIWKKAAGSMDRKGQKPFYTTTKNRTASIAKSITAVAAMQLVESSKIDLDAPIQTYLPAYPQSKLGQITTRHLLNHTSGIGGYKGKEASTQTDYPTLTNAMEVFKDRELLFAPGSQYSYTSYGYVVLGAIIESASGMAYSAYMQEHIFTPAGMTSTGIEITGQSYEYKNEVLHRNGKGKISGVKKVNNISGRVPAGGFYSTVEDLVAFGNALLDGTLISKASMEDMFHDPKIRPIDAGNPYTSGWHIYNNKAPAGRIMGHSGGQFGVSSQLMVLPELNAVVAIMANTSGSLNEVRNQSIRLISCMKLDRDYTKEDAK